MSPQLEIQILGAIVAAACALMGVFLVLRRMALMSDAISHSVLFGIVVGFFLIKNTDSPLLIITATMSGVLTVWLVETLLRTRLVKEDASIGLVFPVLFSIGVIMISREASNVHIDNDAVLLGELAFAPFNRVEMFGLDMPRGLLVMGIILLVDVVLVLLFYKELKIATFDPALAAVMGFAPVLLHYGLMTAVSITAVGAFDHVGAILVVAFMIAPAASAYLLTDRLSWMLVLSVVIGMLSAVTGYWLARWLDINISSAMALMTGILFMIVLFFAPQRGVIAMMFERNKRRRRFAVEMLLVHLGRHEGRSNEQEENSVDHLVTELNWESRFANSTIHTAERHNLIQRRDNFLLLTGEGREMMQLVLSR